MKNLKECLVDSKPFMKLNKGDNITNDNAPVLNYNIPQKASFTAYGTNVLDLDEEFFNDRAKQEPTQKLEQIKKIEINDLIKSIETDIENKNENSEFIFDLEKANTNTFLKSLEEDDKNNTKALTELPIEVSQKQKYSASNQLKITIDKELGVDINYLARNLKDDKVAIISESFGKFKKKLDFVKRPKHGECFPMIFIIEEYKTSSYLGDYGAGKTINTFSLLPGEKTTISVKSFHEKSETKSRSENIMDSFSENSAAEFENILTKESNIAESYSNSYNLNNQHSVTNNFATSVSVSALIKKIFKISANASYDRKGFTDEQSVLNIAASRNSNINNLSEALEKHSNSTNSNREVEVNTTSQTTETQSTEKSTIRELENPNLNRVLNFVFRQLQQEYISVTYLNNIKIAFSNGHPEKTVVVSINELDKLLKAVIKPYYIDTVRNKILHDYMKIENHENVTVDFLEKINYNKITHEIENNKSTNNNNPSHIKPIYKDIVYYKKKARLKDSYTSGGLQIEVPGIILNVSRNTLRTPAVITDAILGQGNALDCFNQLQQEAAAEKLQIENNKLQTEIKSIELEQQKLDLALEIISKLPPEQQAEAYKTMLNNCCDAGQITINN